MAASTATSLSMLWLESDRRLSACKMKLAQHLHQSTCTSMRRQQQLIMLGLCATHAPYAYAPCTMHSHPFVCYVLLGALQKAAEEWKSYVLGQTMPLSVFEDRLIGERKLLFDLGVAPHLLSHLLVSHKLPFDLGVAPPRSGSVPIAQTALQYCLSTPTVTTTVATEFMSHHLLLLFFVLYTKNRKRARI